MIQVLANKSIEDSILESAQAAHKRIDAVKKKVGRHTTILSFLVGFNLRDAINVPDWMVEIVREILINL